MRNGYHGEYAADDSNLCAVVLAADVDFTMALAGGCLGFLVWNLHPAKCFMGDTGSMYLGASVVAVGLVTHQHLVLLLVALLYILEALSVVIQVTYFKYTKKKYGEGRRIFKMTPIHHHFELSGFSEYKIVITFSVCLGNGHSGIAVGIVCLKVLFAQQAEGKDVQEVAYG